MRRPLRFDSGQDYALEANRVTPPFFKQNYASKVDLELLTLRHHTLPELIDSAPNQSGFHTQFQFWERFCWS
ncbi:hypothetical protein AMTR_s00073p00181960, partial [Amborella trichopoda]